MGMFDDLIPAQAPQAAADSPPVVERNGRLVVTPADSQATAPAPSFDDLIPHKFGLEDTWPARLVKSFYHAAVSGATLPGDVYSGDTKVDPSNPDFIGRSLDFATMGTPMSPAARAGAGFLGAVKTVDAPAPTQEALEAAAAAGYDKARNLGVEIHPAAVASLGKKIGASLNEMGIDGELAPKTFSILNRLKTPEGNAVVTQANLETLRRSLGHAAGDFTNPTEQLAAKRAQGHLADYLDTIPPEDVIRGPASQLSGIIKNANGNYAAAKRSDLLAEELAKADQNAGAANSGANLGNAQRAKLKQIFQSDRKSAGFTDAELAKIDQIIRGTPLANATRAAGNALGGGGGLGAVASAAAGAAATSHLGGVGAVAPVVGYGLKKWSDAIGQREIERLQEAVRHRSPLGESMPATVAGSVSPRQAFIVRAITAAAAPRPNESNEARLKRESGVRALLALVD